MAVYRRTNPSGGTVWLVSYKDAAGKRRRPSFDKKADAVAFEARTIEEVRRGTHTPDDAFTVADAGDAWVSRKKSVGRTATTVKQYEEHVRCHIKPLLGKDKLSRLSTVRVEWFVDRLLGIDADGQQTLPVLCSLALARKVLTSLKSLLKEAQRKGRVAQNVALPVKVESSARHDAVVVIPTKAELRLMLDKVTTLATRWRPLLIVAMFTGLRPSELRGLCWDDINFIRKTITVKRRADRFNDLDMPKSRAGQRVVPMSPLVIQALREWRLACPKGALNLVFPNTLGTLMHASDISRLFWHSLMATSGFEEAEDGSYPYEFRHLRHVAASLFIEQGATPKRIQIIMGHSSVRVTFDIYGHLFSDDDADQAMVSGAEQSLFGGLGTH